MGQQIQPAKRLIGKKAGVAAWCLATMATSRTCKPFVTAAGAPSLIRCLLKATPAGGGKGMKVGRARADIWLEARISAAGSSVLLWTHARIAGFEKLRYCNPASGNSGCLPNQHRQMGCLSNERGLFDPARLTRRIVEEAPASGPFD